MNQVQLINNIIVDDKYGIKELPPSQDLFLRGDYINPNLTKQIVNNSFDGKRPCSAAIIGCNNTSLSNEKLKYPFWTAHDAEENYLLSKPTCFLVLGKEGCGATELGERLAHHWKCVHLNPENIILNEMEQNSVTGKCMNFNMRHNKPLTSEILMSILSEKLNSPIVQHRGYVLTGFPLVNTTEKVAELQPVCYSELALIIAYDIISDIISVCILVKPNKKSRKSDFNEEENLEEEASIAEEIVDEMIENEGNVDFDKDAITIEDLKMMSSLEICEDIIKKRSKTALVGLKSSISKQLFHIFDLPLVPDIIIYVTCPDEDIVTKQEHSVVSYPHMNSITLPFTSSGKSISDIRWPTKYMNEEKLKIRKPISTDNHKYHTKLPSHFRKPVLFQMCNYNKFVLPFIENEFTKYDPNSILKVDGRYTIDAMFETVLSQLTNLSVTPTLIPTTLLKYMQETLLDYAENEGENPIPEDYVEFWNFIGNLTPFHLPSSIQFNLSSSLWHNKCPVQLSLGRSLNGKTKFAAIMFNKVYLLSTKEHLIEFCKNPRPYLKLEHLKLTCRILILGTKSSGKSSVAVLLKWLLDAEIINFNNIVNEEKSRKYKAYVASILNLIIPVVEQQRRSEWEAKETARKRELNIFLDKRVLEAEKYVQQYEKALKEKIKMQEERKQKGKERKQAMGAEGDENLPGEDEYDFEEEIDYELSQKILENKDNALNEAPQYLTDALPIPTSPQDGDEDVNQLVSKYITDKEPFDELTPVPEDVVKVLTTLVKTIEENTIRETNGRNQYGRWIVDGFSPSPEYWQILIESGIIPDEVICLVDDREIDEEFYKTSYKLFTNPVSTQQYAKIKDPLIQLKLSHSLNIPETLDAHSIAKQSEEKAFKVVEDDMNKLENEITELNESLKEFREQWASSKAMLEELGKMPIEIITGEIDILQIMSEVVRFLRIHMNKPCEPYETGEQSEDAGSEQTDNEIKYIKEDNRFLGDMGLYCPVAYQTHGVLWKGKSEFATKFDNKIYFFSSEENLEKFKGDPTIFLNASNPFKKLPPPRICVVGGQGTGRSSVSKFIAEELGIFHIDFSIIVNSIILPPHFKKVGIQFENIFTDNLHQADEENDEAERVEDDEADDVRFLLNNEKLFRQRVQDYFEQGTPLPNEILRNAIKHLWFTEPYLSGGFVLDGFPLLLADVESMISMCAIPDCVIELSAECETIVSRLVPVMLDKWKKQQDAAMKESQKKFKLLHDKWRQTIERPVFIQLPIKDIEARNKSKGEKPMERLYSVDANVSNETNNLYEDALQTNPEPINTSEWETFEEAEARIEARIDNVCQVQVDNIKSMQEIFTENQIDWFSVDASMTLSKVIKKCYLYASSLSKRNTLFFEQTYVLSEELSEYLISKGFIFLSKFRHYCPVHVAEKPKFMVNMHKAYQKNENLYHVLYRNHVYFLWGMENMKHFRSDPLKYVTCENIDSFTAFPLKLAIVGPPKSGKSSLTARFVKFYSIKPISRGQAVRHVLERFEWITLAKKIHHVLSTGEALSPELIMKAVQLISTCPETYSQGVVYDGFPSSPCEAGELVKAGIYPFFIIDLTADKEATLKFSLGDSHYHIHRLPLYSQLLLGSRFEVWLATHKNLRNWIKAEFQNDYIISTKPSKWQVWKSSNEIVQSGVVDVGSYVLNVAYRPVPLKSMCISTKEFMKRSSNIKGFCPVCLLVNRMRCSHDLTDRKGLLQYRGLFYWVCEEHHDVFCSCAQFYLTSVEGLALPSEIATPVQFYEPESLYESGWCIVTYFERLPRQILIKGKNYYALRYQNHVYLFCSSLCQKKFAEKPFKYCCIQVMKNNFSFPEITLKTLPAIGYLEQTLSRILTDACFNVAMLRPVYPGLTITQSALVHIALYLKINNPRISKEARTLYVQSNCVYEVRCEIRERASKFLRSMDNPFLQKPKCCPLIPKLDTGSVEKCFCFHNQSESDVEHL